MLSRHTHNPVEEWEFPIVRGTTGLTGEAPDGSANRGSPGRTLPSGVLADLRRALGGSPRNLLLVPSACRDRGRLAGGRVCAPTQVLALGQQALALWVDLLGVQVQFPFPALALVQDAAELGHRRLTLLTAGERVVVRYDRGSRRQVHGFVREALVRSPLPALSLPPWQLGPFDVAAWWREVAQVCADADASVRSGRPPGWWHHRSARRCLVAVTATGVVIIQGPTRAAPHRTADATYMARHAMRAADVGTRTVVLHLGGATVAVGLGRRICAWLRQRLQDPPVPVDALGPTPQTAADGPQPTEP